MINRIRRFVYCAALTVTLQAGLSPVAHAVGSQSNVNITLIDVRDNGYFIIDISQPTQGTPPTCASGVPNRLVGDGNTAGGKNILATAMAAFLAGKKVAIEGTGTCPVYNTIEGIRILWVLK